MSMSDDCKIEYRAFSYACMVMAKREFKETFDQECTGDCLDDVCKIVCDCSNDGYTAWLEDHTGKFDEVTRDIITEYIKRLNFPPSTKESYERITELDKLVSNICCRIGCEQDEIIERLKELLKDE